MTLNSIQEYINNGQRTYLNKTRLYLAPCMEGYGEEVMQAINNLQYFWCGIDFSWTRYIVYYYLKDTNYSKILNNYRAKYYNENLNISYGSPLDVKIIRLKVPKSMHKAYDKFIHSKYSEMYNREQLEKIFIKPDPRFGNLKVKELALPVLTKHPKRKETFEKLINSWSKDKDWEDTYIHLPDSAELDTLWKIEHEVLEI